MNTSVKRRFIAGAECPNCQSIDSLYVYAGDLNGAFECASCGHREENPDTQKEKNTDLNSEVQAVKFVDASKA